VEVYNVLEGPLVFVDVDTQRDFLEPAGALYVPDSTQILANLARLTRFALCHNIPILATACCHSPGDPELARFGPHCMAGTRGQERVPETACPGSQVFDAALGLSGRIPRHVTVLKSELDVFRNPHVGELVALYNAGHPKFVVYGVATDYCVGSAVEGLLMRHCRVAIVADAIRALDPATELVILSDFARRGAELTVTDIVCRAP
jgi:nicotinamidase/pyrazinamidase